MGLEHPSLPSTLPYSGLRICSSPCCSIVTLSSINVTTKLVRNANLRPQNPFLLNHNLQQDPRWLIHIKIWKTLVAYSLVRVSFSLLSNYMHIYSHTYIAPHIYPHKHINRKLIPCTRAPQHTHTTHFLPTHHMNLHTSHIHHTPPYTHVNYTRTV